MGSAQEAIATEVNGDDRIRELAKKLKPVKLAAQSL
jgi:hypothetical protein